MVRCGYVPDAFTLEGAYCKTSCGIPVAVARSQEKRQKKVESYVAVAVESSSKEAMKIWILGQRGSGIGLYITTRPISGSLARSRGVPAPCGALRINKFAKTARYGEGRAVNEPRKWLIL